MKLSVDTKFEFYEKKKVLLMCDFFNIILLAFKNDKVKLFGSQWKLFLEVHFNFMTQRKHKTPFEG